MDKFQYTIIINEINNLTTKKAKKELFDKLLFCDEDTANGFKALTYLVKTHGKDLLIGTQTNRYITDYLLEVADYVEADYKDLLQFCDSDFTLSEYHTRKLYDTRYLPFQVAAYMLKKGI